MIKLRGMALAVLVMLVATGCFNLGSLGGSGLTGPVDKKDPEKVAKLFIEKWAELDQDGMLALMDDDVWLEHTSEPGFLPEELAAQVPVTKQQAVANLTDTGDGTLESLAVTGVDINASAGGAIVTGKFEIHLSGPDGEKSATGDINIVLKQFGEDWLITDVTFTNVEGDVFGE